MSRRVMLQLNISLVADASAAAASPSLVAAGDQGVGSMAVSGDIPYS